MKIGTTDIIADYLGRHAFVFHRDGSKLWGAFDFEHGQVFSWWIPHRLKPPLPYCCVTGAGEQI